MIPRIIHFCWFSNEITPSKLLECSDTWKNNLKDFQIKLWTAQEFDVNIVEYTRQAFQAGKFAFVSDYFRLWVLYHYGGLYLDYDMIINKDFSILNKGSMIFGWEKMDLIGAHAIGSVPNHKFLKDCLEFYNKKNFINKKGRIDLTPMPYIITKILKKKYSLCKNGKFQKLPHSILVYPMNYLTININDGNNIGEHLFFGSWNDNKLDYIGILKKHYYKHNTSIIGRISYFLIRVRLKFVFLLKKVFIIV